MIGDYTIFHLSTSKKYKKNGSPEPGKPKINF